MIKSLEYINEFHNNYNRINLILLKMGLNKRLIND